MSSELEHELKAHIRDVHDFPKKGIVFKDITTLLKKPDKLKQAAKEMGEPFLGQKIDFVAGIESRGFVFAPMIAHSLNAGFIPIRKPGKLPAEVEQVSYELEYGTDSLEIHKDSLGEKDKVLIVDDLLATGGTARATKELIEKLGGNVVAFSFLVELTFLKGKEKLGKTPVHSVVKY